MEIQAASLSEKAALGQGYDAQKEEFVGRCAQGTIEFAGMPEAHISFDRSLDEKTMSRELGFEVGARARYGLTTGSLAAQFASESSASEYADVSIYSHTINLKNAQLRFPGTESGLTPEGKSARGTTQGNLVGENWPITCGHEFVSQITLGAKLLVSVKLEFSTHEDKTAFSAELGVESPVFALNTNIKLASKRFGKRASVSIHAYQLGGDVRRLSSILSVASGHAPILTASLENPDAVLAALDAVIKYSSQDFPNQIDPQMDPDSPIGPAQLSYITSPWSELGLFAPPPIVAAGVIEARRLLSAAFEHHAAFQRRLSRILFGPVRLSPRQLVRFKAMQAIVAHNLALIQDAALVAYTDFLLASAKVAQTIEQLVDFPPEDFEVRPESFAQWWDMKDLPGTLREDKNVLDEMALTLIPLFNDFDQIEDEGLALQRQLETRSDLGHVLSLINVGFPSASDRLIRWLETPVGTVLLDANLSDLRDVTLNEKSSIKFLSNLPQPDLVESFSVSAPSGNAIDLRGLDRLTGVRSVSLHNLSGTVDLKPIAALTKLENLTLQGPMTANPQKGIFDLTSLSSLVQLKQLQLSVCEVENLDALASLKGLEKFGAYESVRSVLSLGDLANLASIGVMPGPIEGFTALVGTRLNNLFVDTKRIVIQDGGPDLILTRQGNTNAFDGQRGGGEVGIVTILSMEVDGQDIVVQFDSSLDQRLYQGRTSADRQQLEGTFGVSNQEPQHWIATRG